MANMPLATAHRLWRAGATMCSFADLPVVPFANAPELSYHLFMGMSYAMGGHYDLAAEYIDSAIGSGWSLNDPRIQELIRVTPCLLFPAKFNREAKVRALRLFKETHREHCTEFCRHK